MSCASSATNGFEFRAGAFVLHFQILCFLIALSVAWQERFGVLKKMTFHFKKCVNFLTIFAKPVLTLPLVNS